MYKVAETQTDLKLEFEYEFTLEGKDYFKWYTEGFITDYYNKTYRRNPANRWVRQDMCKDFKIELDRVFYGRRD